jgi:SAM-dependent methyltransferase
VTVSVLQTSAEILEARDELQRRGLSCLGPSYVRALRRFHVIPGVNVGDARKSWDVLKTITFLEEHLSLDSPIVDLGAFASEIPCAMHRLGFSRVVGVDLSARIGSMPYANSVHYVIGDFHRTPLRRGSFSAVTAISVIEHGFDAERLLSEVDRLLSPGGYFLASFDYWPDKINTSGINLFGMDWRIFSRADVEALLAKAASFGLVGEGRVDLQARDRVVRSSAKEYTFGWFALRKLGR